MATRTTAYPFKCGNCDAAFRFEANLKSHVNIRHANDDAMAQEPQEQCYLLKEVSPNPDYPFRCSVCRAFFSQEANVKSHYETLHLKNAQKHSKQEQFKAQLMPQEQLKEQDQVQGQFNNAAKAQEQFNNAAKVQRQAKRKRKAATAHVQKLKTRFPCHHCPKTLASVGSRKKHMDHFHLGRGHSCPQLDCSFLAQSPSHLKQHLISHSNVRPFSCDQCHKKFKSANNLKKHVNDVHLKLRWPKIVSVYSQKLE